MNTNNDYYKKVREANDAKLAAIKARKPKPFKGLSLSYTTSSVLPIMAAAISRRGVA